MGDLTFLVKTYEGNTKLLSLPGNTFVEEFKNELLDIIFQGETIPEDNNLQFRINNKNISFQPIGEFNTITEILKFNNIDVNFLINVEWSGRLKGGIFMLLINMTIAIFKFILFIPKFLIWVVEFIIYLIKLLVYLIKLAIDATSVDGIMGLVNFISGEIVLAPFKVFFALLKKFVNSLGDMTVKAIWGVDNVDNVGNPDSDEGDNACMGDKKCYKTPDGTVPFSVVIATILCPPVGVFMEYGILGWFNILICSLLTLMFYFPGLIYALILLYC